MPRGIKGFRWIETGRRVWALESKPRYFHGFVSEYVGREPPCTAYTQNRVPTLEGDFPTRRDAMNFVEALTLDCPARMQLIHHATGLNFCDQHCPCGQNNQLWWTPTWGNGEVPEWALWMNGVDTDSIWSWLVENGKVNHA